MDKILRMFLRFTEGSYSFTYKALSLIPGTIIFLGITPLLLFFLSRYLGSFIPLIWPRNLEIIIALTALSLALFLMSWSLIALWTTGQGTPAPIAPTRKLVTTGPYAFCRNPMEVGTAAYFLFVGSWFDSLITGILCLLFGLILGCGYIKLIEERELKLRFGQEYEEYRSMTPLFLLSFSCRRQKGHGC